VARSVVGSWYAAFNWGESPYFRPLDSVQKEAPADLRAHCVKLGKASMARKESSRVKAMQALMDMKLAGLTE